METLCTNIDYYIPDDKGATKSFSEDAMARLRKKRFITPLYFLFSFLSVIKSKGTVHTHRTRERRTVTIRIAEKDNNGVFLKQ